MTVSFSELRGRMGSPALAAVWEQLAERWSNAGDRRVASIDLGRLDEASRVALADLLGLDRVPESAGRLDVSRVERELGVDEVTLRDAVADLVGPIADRAAARADDDARRRSLWSWVQSRCDDRGLSGWYRHLRSSGVPGGDIAGFRRELATVFSALDDLPADGIPLAVFAAKHWGDPHALDVNERPANLLLGAIARLEAKQRSLGTERAAAETRRLWESVGVVPDELSSSVSTLGLTVADRHPLAEYMARAAGESEPIVLTLDQLRRHPIEVAEAGPVRVVENPSVLAEAARRKTAGVFVCTFGWPSVAVMMLLEGLSAARCELFVHADFDANGLGIVGLLQSRFGATPWAMGATDYVPLVSRSAVSLDDDKPLPETQWDPDLHAEMTRHRRVVYEEHAIEQLLTGQS